MRSAAWSLILLLTIALFAGSSVEAKGALFFEKVLIAGDAGDFPNAALDVEAVYVSELYPYDPEKEEAFDRVVVRIEPRSLSAMSDCQVPSGDRSYVGVCSMRVDVHFEVAGKAQHLFAVLANPGSSACCPVASSNTLTSTDGISIRMSLDRPAMMMAPGAKIEKLYVTTALIAQGQTQPGDRAPGDNQNQPHDRVPEIQNQYAEPYTLTGTYEFFTIEVEDGTHRDSVGGQSVEFDLFVTPTAGVRDDNIRFIFDIPQGWGLTPSRGSTGASPRGLLTGISEGTTAELSLTIGSNEAVAQGDIVTIVVHAYSSSQGYKAIPLTVRVTGTTIEHPDYVFQWMDATTLQEGQKGTLRFAVHNQLGEPLLGLPIDVVFSKDGKRVTTLPASADGESYKVDYAFPSSGTWTIDARITSLQPSPHSSITVQVGADAVPGIGPAVLLLLVGMVLALKTRLRRGT